MNIFYTDPSPEECANSLDDKRLIKMCLETAQILSTVLHLNGIKGPYKATHKGHPCTKWAAEDWQHFEWLYNHGIMLCTEYARRFGKLHKCQNVIDRCWRLAQPLIPSREDGDPLVIELPPNVTSHKERDVINAYRAHLNDKWDRDGKAPKWTLRKPPAWCRRTFSRDPATQNYYTYDQPT